MELGPGIRIGNWEVIAPIGEGGMGSVFLCRDALGQRLTAAVKVNRSYGDEGRKRFIREVEALSRVRHPGIVSLLGWGEDQHLDVLWLAMEALTGPTLEARLTQGPMPEAEARQVFGVLASALQHAHAAGVFHRDVKPANIILATQGPVLVDFGIALQQDRSRLTLQNHLPGTPAYMPPEVFTANTAPDLRLADIYGLGLILYEALTGSGAVALAEGMTEQQRFARVLSAKFSPVELDPGPEFSEGLRALVRRATAPDPAQRLGDWGEFLALLADRQPQAATSSPAPPATQRGPLLVASLVGALVVLLIAFFAWRHFVSLPPEPAPLPVVQDALEPQSPAVLAPDLPPMPAPQEPQAGAEVASASVPSKVPALEPTSSSRPKPAPAKVSSSPVAAAALATTPDAALGEGDLHVTLAGGESRRLRSADIIFAQRQDQNTRLVTVAGELTCEETVTDLDRLITDSRLLRVHRDYLVNARYVTAVAASSQEGVADGVATTRAGSVPVSQRYLNTLRQAAGLQEEK